MAVSSDSGSAERDKSPRESIAGSLMRLLGVFVGLALLAVAAALLFLIKWVASPGPWGGSFAFAPDAPPAMVTAALVVLLAAVCAAAFFVFRASLSGS